MSQTYKKTVKKKSEKTRHVAFPCILWIQEFFFRGVCNVFLSSSLEADTPNTQETGELKTPQKIVRKITEERNQVHIELTDWLKT